MQRLWDLLIAAVTDTGYARHINRHAAILLSVIVVVMFSGAASACNSPSGVEGEIIMNGTYNVPQYCDGDDWIAMTGGKSTCPGGLTSCGKRSYERVVFVTSSTMRADSNNGDDICQARAEEAGLKGKYFAWYSTSAADAPATRFERSTVPYVLVDGTKVADNWDDLTDGTLDNSIYKYETGAPYTGFSVATNTLIDGTYNSNLYGRGTGYNSNNGWTDTGSPTSGAVGSRRYCFEQKTAGTDIVPDGLAAHWRLDETSGTTAYDSSGNDLHIGYTGGLDASYHENGMVGIALNTMGMTGGDPGGRATVDSSFTGMKDFSVSFWVKLEDASATRGILEISDFFLIRKPHNREQISFSARAWSSQNGDWSISIPAHQWVHVTITYSYDDPAGTRPVFYLNGQIISSGQSFSSQGVYIPPSVTTLYFARRYNSTSSVWRGGLDDIRVYNRRLDQNEITQIYEARDGIRYNADKRIMEYFDGNRFVSMTPVWPDVTGGLQLHWKLDETSGALAVDSSGNGRDGNILGAPILGQRGAVGSAFNLNRTSSDCINCDMIRRPGASIDYSSGSSFSLWFNTARVRTAGAQRLMSHGYTGGRGAWLRPTASGSLNWAVNISTGIYSLEAPGVFGDGIWRHVVGTWSPDGAMRLYINGALVSQRADAPGVFLADPGNINVGSRDFSNEFIDGLLDDVRIYNRPLAEADVRALYNMGTPVGQNTALPQGCPNIGDACDDGTIYAGLSPDGNVPMFITPIYTYPGINWNTPGYSGYRPTGATNDNTGAANTALILQTDADTAAGFQIHAAAHHCASMTFNGADDFYLPAIAELSALYDEHEALAGIGTHTFWSSTESSTNTARTFSFSTGTANSFATKNGGFSVLCIRKGPAPRCANPYGIEGQMMYNQDYGVVQYCDGARWIAIGKAAP